MIKNITFFLILLMIFSLTLLNSRSFRVTQVPNGSKFNCNTCHTNGGGTPRNPFGQEVESITGSNNVTFWGPELAAKDADVDGFSNGQELQDPNGEWTPGEPDPGDFAAVTHPGDASDFPPITAVEDIAELSSKFALDNNYPNPFNPSTNIFYQISKFTSVRLEVFNSLGERVRKLADQFYTPGYYITNWNGTDDSGNRVNSGIYIYRLITDNFVASKRMVLLK